jgi:hypothetical protein
VVAQTVAVRGDRPTANAFGIAVARSRPELGEVRLDAQPLDQAVQLGRLLRAHLVRAHRRQRDLVRGEELDQEQHRRDHRDRDRAGSRGEQDADQDRVNQPEQEQRQQHPGLEPGVATE